MVHETYLAPDPWSVYQHTVAMQIAAAVSTLMLYPLDSVKFRIMSQDGTMRTRYHASKGDFTGLIHALQKTYQIEGFAALYRGACISIHSSVLSWGIYMFAYKKLLLLVQKGEWGGGRDYTLSSEVSLIFMEFGVEVVPAASLLNPSSSSKASSSSSLCFTS